MPLLAVYSTADGPRWNIRGSVPTLIGITYPGHVHDMGGVFFWGRFIETFGMGAGCFRRGRRW